MRTKKVSRRDFITTVSTGTAAVLATSAFPNMSKAVTNTNHSSKLAALGGKPAITQKIWPAWPQVNAQMYENINDVIRSTRWARIDNPVNGTVAAFEREFAKLMGVKGCIATGSGTQSLNTCVEAMGFGPGDEIITTPYTDMGTIAAIIVSRALPIMADLDKDSFQLDPKDVERKITKNTKAIIPVHMMGQPCDMRSIMAIAQKHNLKVIEDACQAHLAEFDGKKLGAIGDIGCFSFQTSKTICCGEGGGIISNDEQLLDQCYTVQNHGTDRKGRSVTIGSKYRMNELEGAILMAQLPFALEQYGRRNRNAAYLTSKLKGFQGLTPQKLYDGTNSGSFYLYTMRFHSEHFGGATRDQFLKAIAAEGIALSPYIKNGLHREPWTENILSRREYKQMYKKDSLDLFRSCLQLPACDDVCANMVMLWASGPLLAELSDMDDIINAIMKVYENRNDLKNL
jgi:dTDP-4-amino-4,6-dideoxygalactose transaminase